MNLSRVLAAICILVFTSQALAKDFSYSHGEQKFAGEFYPAKSKKSPGIVLVHNWMGVTEESSKQAKRFQALGYNVLVADIYGEGVRPKSPQEAGALATKYKTDRKLLRERVSLAIAELKKMKDVNAEKLAVLGYCFGGTAAIESARSGETLKAVISFHGGLDSPTPNDGAQIKAGVLALHGAIDPYVKDEDLKNFEAEMAKHKVNFELIKYGGAVHSFTDLGAGNDISKGAAYNESADKKSFQRAKEFLAEAFN
jgi:dienelactone hydrolase